MEKASRYWLKVCLISLCLILICLQPDITPVQPQDTSTPEPAIFRTIEQVTAVQVVSTVRVRMEPSTSGGNATVIRSAQAGEQFDVRPEVDWVEADGYTWVPVIVDNQEAWVAEQGFVTLVTEEIQIPIDAEEIERMLSTPLLDGASAFGSESNALPLPVGGSASSSDTETIRTMQSAGMTWVGRFVSVDNLDFVRAEIETWQEAGFKVLLTVMGNIDQLREMGAEYYPIFAEQLAAIAELGPDAIEVWREMNIDGNWPAGDIDPDNYADMLQQAYTAIKATNHNVLVITGALAATGFYGGCSANGCNDDLYYAGMAEAGVADFADCIGVRYLEGAVSPDKTTGDPRVDFPTYYFPTMLERAATPFADQDIPLCFTNIGYISADGFEQAGWTRIFSWATSVSVTEQAEWLRDTILIAREDGRVALIIINNIDFPESDLDAASGWAITRPDGTCPACETIGSLRLLAD